MSAGIDYLRGWGTPKRPRPQRHRSRPDLCAERGHPGNCYNPWHDKTWCLCGERIYDGDVQQWPKPNECGGSLCECLPGCPDRPRRCFVCGETETCRVCADANRPEVKDAGDEFGTEPMRFDGGELTAD